MKACNPNSQDPAPNVEHHPPSGALAAVDRLMRQALAHGIFPGAVLLVARGGRRLMHAAYGTANLTPSDR